MTLMKSNLLWAEKNEGQIQQKRKIICRALAKISLLFSVTSAGPNFPKISTDKASIQLYHIAWPEPSLERLTKESGKICQNK